MTVRKPMDERFWAKVDKSGECWLWTGAKNNKGYGQIGLPGRGTGSMLAHRYSFLLHYGPIHVSLFICHKCDTPLCVRPDHLFAGTSRDNVRDMVTKGRMAVQQRTHCPQGHEYTGENLILSGPREHRRCRTCAIHRNREYRQEKSNEACLRRWFPIEVSPVNTERGSTHNNKEQA